MNYFTPLQFQHKVVKPTFWILEKTWNLNRPSCRTWNRSGKKYSHKMRASSLERKQNDRNFDIYTCRKFLILYRWSTKNVRRTQKSRSNNSLRPVNVSRALGCQNNRYVQKFKLRYIFSQPKFSVDFENDGEKIFRSPNGLYGCLKGQNTHTVQSLENFLLSSIT